MRTHNGGEQRTHRAAKLGKKLDVMLAAHESKTLVSLKSTAL